MLSGIIFLFLIIQVHTMEVNVEEVDPGNARKRLKDKTKWKVTKEKIAR